MASDVLVDRIYEAAIVPERWTSVLHDMTRIAGAKDAALALFRGADVRMVNTSPAFDQIWNRVFSIFPGASNERTRRLVAARHEGFVTDADVFEPGEITRFSMFSDHLIPAGYGSGCATSISAPSGDIVVVHVEGSYDAPIDRNVVAKFDQLRPHLARAGLLASRLGLERAKAATLALEAIGLPAAVIDHRGRALAMNGLMDDLIPTVLQDRPSRLALSNVAADRLMAEGFASLAGASTTAAVCSIPLIAENDRNPAVIHLVPIRGAARDVFAQALGLLVMTPLGRSVAPSASILSGLFDLSPAEARVARLLVDGCSIKEIAAASGTSVATVRNQLRAVFAKTGVARQSELVAMCGRFGLMSPAV